LEPSSKIPLAASSRTPVTRSRSSDTGTALFGLLAPSKRKQRQLISGSSLSLKRLLQPTDRMTVDRTPIGTDIPSNSQKEAKENIKLISTSMDNHAVDAAAQALQGTIHHTVNALLEPLANEIRQLRVHQQEQVNNPPVQANPVNRGQIPALPAVNPWAHHIPGGLFQI